LTWQPTRADVSRSGDLGYTVGSFERKSSDPQGNPAVRRGKYVTIWKKQADGNWKVVVDIGNLDQPPPARRGGRQ
jgi:ketosteroid isomerase-like protein